MLGIPGEGFEYEQRMLLRLGPDAVAAHEVPIDTVYLDRNSSSHFRPVRDSLRVLLPVLLFASSSLAAFVVDTVALLVLQALTGWLVPSIIAARVLSATANFVVNRRVVFRAGEGPMLGQAVRYGVLALALLASNIAWMSFLTDNGLALLPAKVVTEGVLFVLSYGVQRALVFFPRTDAGSPPRRARRSPAVAAHPRRPPEASTGSASSAPEPPIPLPPPPQGAPHDHHRPDPGRGRPRRRRAAQRRLLPAPPSARPRRRLPRRERRRAGGGHRARHRRGGPGPRARPVRVLSIIRLRSSEITQREVAYYFAALAIGPHLRPARADLATPLLLVGLIVAVLAVADHPRVLSRARHQTVHLDRAIADETELRAELERLLGGESPASPCSSSTWSTTPHWSTCATACDRHRRRSPHRGRTLETERTDHRTGEASFADLIGGSR